MSDTGLVIGIQVIVYSLTHYFYLQNIVNYSPLYCYLKNVVIVCSHSSSTLQAGVSHQTENESVSINVGDGVETTNKPADEHSPRPRNGQVCPFVRKAMTAVTHRRCYSDT